MMTEYIARQRRIYPVTGRHSPACPEPGKTINHWPLSTTVILGFSLSRSFFSFSSGMMPNFSPTLSDQVNPMKPHAMSPTPNPSLAFFDKAR